MPLTCTINPIPQHYLLLLFPAHQPLDSQGPIDILSTVCKQTHPSGLSTDLTLTIAAETLDPVPFVPVPPTSQLGEWEVDLDGVKEFNQADEGGKGGMKRRGMGFDQRSTPNITFEGALRDLKESGGVRVRNAWGEEEWRPIDVLLVPGGIGTRLSRVYKSGERVSNVKSVVEFIEAILSAKSESGESWVRSAVLSVCTGSDLLARADVLAGRRATTNALAFDGVTERNKSKNVRWLRNRRWVRSLPGEVQERLKAGSYEESIKGDEPGTQKALVYGREIWTSAGISAGIDLALWFVAEVYGREFARGIGRRLEYEWREGVGDGEIDSYYEDAGS